MGELETGSKAQAMVHELREVADVIERVPELVDEDNPVDAALLLLMDLDELDLDDDL
jgi:hypothetical protein